VAVGAAAVAATVAGGCASDSPVACSGVGDSGASAPGRQASGSAATSRIVITSGNDLAISSSGRFPPLPCPLARQAGCLWVCGIAATAGGTTGAHSSTGRGGCQQHRVASDSILPSSERVARNERLVPSPCATPYHGVSNVCGHAARHKHTDSPRISRGHAAACRAPLAEMPPHTTGAKAPASKEETKEEKSPRG